MCFVYLWLPGLRNLGCSEVLQNLSKGSKQLKDVLKAPKMAVVRTEWIELFNEYVAQHYGQEDKHIPLTGKWLSQMSTWILVHPVLLSLQKVTMVCHVITKLYCHGSPWSGTSCNMIVHIKLVVHRQVAYEPKCFYVNAILH